MKCPKKLRLIRKVFWIIHEMFGCMGHVVWINHKIQEIDEALEEYHALVGGV